MSLASVPEFAKNTLASGMPDISAIFSANSIWDSIRYSVELCSIRSAWSLIASTTRGTAWPAIVTRIPPKKSKYRLPSASVTCRPAPSTSEDGLVVVQTDPRGYHRPVAFKQVGMDSHGVPPSVV